MKTNLATLRFKLATLSLPALVLTRHYSSTCYWPVLTQACSGVPYFRRWWQFD